MPATPLPLMVRYARYAVGVSLALHSGLLAILLLDAAWPFLTLARQTASISNQVVLEARTGPRWRPAEESGVAATKTEATNVIAVGEAGRPVEQVFGARSTAHLESAIAEAQGRSSAENQERLEVLTGKLSKLSSEKSVDEMAGKLRQWLGTQRRAERPADVPADGEFDYLTAQLHDVRREEDPEGGFRYFAILVDAAGRRRESIMEPLEGESAYKTMQLVKANPLAEMVYRRIVMGFLDNVIKAGMAAQEKAAEAEAARPPVTPQ